MTSFFRKVKWLLDRRKREAELRAELEFHLDQEAEQRQAGGHASDEAKWAARRDLGNVGLLQEDTRSVWGWILLEQFLQDLRYAFRAMAANKGFSALAILSLGLGIGANTAIYSFMDSILLRALPVSEPESLVVLNWHSQARKAFSGKPETVVHWMSGSIFNDETGLTSGIFPFPAYELFQKSDLAFSSVFGFRPTRPLNLSVRGQAEIASGEFVTGDYFRGLSVPPAAGRLIIGDDDQAGAPAVAVMSYAYSQKRFGGIANAAGQPILINNLPFTVVGVAPPEFFGVDPAVSPDVYIPLHTNMLPGVQPFGRDRGDYIDQHGYWLEVMGRLRPGVSLTQAQAMVAEPFHQWVASTAGNDVERANLPALAARNGAEGLDSLRRRFSKPLYVLMTMVGLILAIACANVANLLLARSSARRREMALRLSVGAGRFRVIRQLLTESVLLASFGGIAGILFALWGIRALTVLLANGQANFRLHPDLNWHVLGVAAALSLLTGVLFGIAPALQSTRVDVISALRESRASEAGLGRRSFWRVNLSHALVVSQIAVSLLMLVAAGLFVRTLTNLQSIDVGFNRESVLLFQLDARNAGHGDPEISSFYGGLREKFGAIPGVRSASLSESSLIGAGTGYPIGIAGQPAADENRILTVGPQFFHTMQVPILAGREIDERDRPGSMNVAVINEVFAKANFGDSNPLGQHLLLSNPPHQREMEIVGVARNSNYGGLKRTTPPVVYLPYDQGYPEPKAMVFELRTAGGPLGYVNVVREIVRLADARVPLSNVRTQTAEIDQTINQEIVFAKLCSAFAILALIIACVGLYGTVSYNVARRTGEIGIRMALGARGRSVVWMVLRDVIVLASIGLAISVPTALGTSKFVASFLYGMKPNDPAALIVAAVVLLAAAIVASYLPARKASRIDPMIALRNE